MLESCLFCVSDREFNLRSFIRVCYFAKILPKNLTRKSYLSQRSATRNLELTLTLWLYVKNIKSYCLSLSRSLYKRVAFFTLYSPYARVESRRQVYMSSERLDSVSGKTFIVWVISYEFNTNLLTGSFRYLAWKFWFFLTLENLLLSTSAT